MGYGSGKWFYHKYMALRMTSKGVELVGGANSMNKIMLKAKEVSNTTKSMIVIVETIGAYSPDIEK